MPTFQSLEMSPLYEIAGYSIPSSLLSFLPVCADMRAMIFGSLLPVSSCQKKLAWAAAEGIPTTCEVGLDNNTTRHCTHSEFRNKERLADDRFGESQALLRIFWLA